MDWTLTTGAFLVELAAVILGLMIGNWNPAIGLGLAFALAAAFGAFSD